MKCRQKAIMWFVCVFACVISAQAHTVNVNVAKQYLAADASHNLDKHTDGSLYGWAKVNKKKGGVLGGVAVGCLLWCLLPICIWNTERISVKQAKMRLKAERYAIHIDDPEREPRDELQGHIVYITGTSVCSEQLQDDFFKHVIADGKIKLRRVVEMFQYIETAKEEGDDDNKKPVYSYSEGWVDHRTEIKNPSTDKYNPQMSVASTRRQEPYRAWALSGSGDDCVAAKTENVRLGKYYLSDYVIRELNTWKNKTDLTAEMLVPDRSIVGCVQEMLFSDRLKDPVKLNQNEDWWYYGEGKEKPSIGDHRVRFEELHPGPITICGVLVKNEKGWSFVPIINKAGAGAGDSLVAECGASCCFSVEEIHFGDPEDDKDFLAAMESREPEIEKSMQQKFRKAGTTKITEYNPEEDMDDLCCVGPFGTMVVRLMHWIGLEDELLAVQEKKATLRGTMNDEATAMEHKVHAVRAGTFCCLLFATWLIISPVMSLLNINIFVSLLGGALISCLICSFAMLCTCAAWVGITSCAWLVYRPFMGALGLAVTIMCLISMIYIFQEGEKKYGEEVRRAHATATFLAVRRTIDNLVGHL